MFIINFQLTLLLRQITGHKEQPRVQQQQRHPQNSHLTLIGSVFLRMPFILITVSLNSSGATLDTNPLGNSVLNLLLKPKLKRNNDKMLKLMNNTNILTQSYYQHP